LSGRGLCDGPIPRPEESYRLWCVSECDQVKIKTLDTCCEQVKEGRTALQVTALVDCYKADGSRILPGSFMLFVPHIFLQLRSQPTYAPNKIHSRTFIKLLHVSAPRCHHQAVFRKKQHKPTLQCW
jgi:hypothetical protein